MSCLWLGSAIQLFELLSPYLCFISFLYLYLFALDDASISKVSKMCTKHPCVMVHIRIKGDVVAVKHV